MYSYNYLVYNIGKNLLLTKFRQYAKLIAIKIKEVPIEGYNSIGKVKKYYTLLR
jgi:hypothetical protein